MKMNKTNRIIIVIAILCLIPLLYFFYVCLSLNGMIDKVDKFIHSSKYKVHTKTITGEYGDKFSDEYKYIDLESHWGSAGTYEHTLYFNQEKILTLQTGNDGLSKEPPSIEGIFNDDNYVIYKVNDNEIIYRIKDEDNAFCVLKYPTGWETLENKLVPIYCILIRCGDFSLAKILLEHDNVEARTIIEKFAQGDLSDYVGNMNSQEKEEIINKAKQLLIQD